MRMQVNRRSSWVAAFIGVTVCTLLSVGVYAQAVLSVKHIEFTETPPPLTAAEQTTAYTR